MHLQASRFHALGETFYTRLPPQSLPSPYWVGRSRAMARELGLDEAWLEQDAALQALSGNTPLRGADPLASVYSGHQFGFWAGQLGDGRALLLGALATPQGAEMEVQLKGAGLTPYSRSGDGRAVLRSSIREFLASEALHGLGIPTTRALCVTGSDAGVRRETLETAAVVTRVAPSFIRFGHFEHFCHHGQPEQLRTLADHVIEHHLPACRDDAAGPYAALLRTVCERTARLLAQWQAVGFCHGVMNTDNMSILGLTLDYGPFQFMDGYDPGHICNHSDSQGRYAFERQPQVAHWNLFCLAQALLPLLRGPEDAMAALAPYEGLYQTALLAHLRAKLGLLQPAEGDAALAQATLHLLAQEHVDYTVFWRRLSQRQAGAPEAALLDLFTDRDAARMWLLSYSEHKKTTPSGLSADLMLKINPKYVLRNHLGEQAIRQARDKDFSGVQNLLTVLQSPFDEHPAFEAWAGLPPAWASGIEISCSS